MLVFSTLEILGALLMRHCRMCSDENLISLLSLGDMYLSGIFPENPLAQLSHGVLELFLCETCTLVQLGESFPADEMYGDNYGYRSGLNATMVGHLGGVVDYACSFVALEPSDPVLDIGSNDGTLLRAYGAKSKIKIGIDPTASKFIEFYEPGTAVVADFFSKANYELHSKQKAKIITSIAMLYDLDDPVSFGLEVAGCLASDGVWVAEQSYMPWMVLTGAYDTICHEHLEYYSLTSIDYLAEKSGLKVIDAEINGANGGSIRVAMAHKGSSLKPSSEVGRIRQWEKSEKIHSSAFFNAFSEYVAGHGSQLRKLVEELKVEGNRIVALGASTKGSIVLQNSGLSAAQIDFVADVNPFKHGRYMSHSDLQVHDEPKDIRSVADYALILPWHFKQTFESKLVDFLDRGGGIIWPLPSISIENRDGTRVVGKLPNLSEAARELLVNTIL